MFNLPGPLREMRTSPRGPSYCDVFVALVYTLNMEQIIQHKTELEQHGSLFHVANRNGRVLVFKS